jgi:RNA polymerase sigma factor (sigma-70 family)
LESLSERDQAADDPYLQAVEDVDERRTEHQAVRQFVAGLPPRQRELVDLVFYRDQSQAQAARALGISRAAVTLSLMQVKLKGKEALAA